MTAPSRHAECPDSGGLVAGYEELRRQVLSGQRGPGLAVLQRRGLREWMNACSLCAAPLSTQARLQTEGEAVIPPAQRTEVVLILAGMLLHRRQETRP